MIRQSFVALFLALPSCGLLQGDDVAPIAGGVGGMAAAYEIQSSTNRALLSLVREKGAPESAIAEIDSQMRDADRMHSEYRASVEAALSLMGSYSLADLRQIVRDVARDLREARQ